MAQLEVLSISLLKYLLEVITKQPMCGVQELYCIFSSVECLRFGERLNQGSLMQLRLLICNSLPMFGVMYLHQPRI